MLFFQLGNLFGNTKRVQRDAYDAYRLRVELGNLSDKTQMSNTSMDRKPMFGLNNIYIPLMFAGGVIETMWRSTRITSNAL